MNLSERTKQMPKSVIIVLGVAVLALVVLFTVGPLLTGSAEVADPPPGSAGPVPLVEAGGPPSVTSFADAASSVGPLPRDPFEALIAPASPAAGAAGAPPPAASPAAAAAAPAPGPGPVAAPAPPAAPAAGPAPPAPVPPPPPAEPAPGPPPVQEPPGAPAPTPAQPVTLLDVYVDLEGTTRAAVKVGQAMYGVRAGESFDNNYRVHQIANNCASFSRFGEAFYLCKGETLTK